MSDIASPILAVMDNEAHAFICFCGIMKRLEGNFRPDGQLMSVKFQHLKLLLQYSDPEFYSYLVSRGADDLFFCYRWLLLELKREFAFDDALRMLEVTWSSLPPDPPETEVELLGPPSESAETAENGEKEPKEKQRRRHMLRPSREEADVGRNGVVEEHDRCAAASGKDPDCRSSRPLERQTSFGDFKYYSAQTEEKEDVVGAPPGIPTRQSTVDSEDDPGEGTPLIAGGTSPPRLWKPVSSSDSPPEPTSPTANGSGVKAPAQHRSLLSSPVLSFGRGPAGRLPSPGSVRAKSAGVRPCSLPPPQEFGKGNPFMLFLCLSILLEHRDHIIKNSLDYNELAMHFDRLVRRHNLSRVLQRAKALFADYLQSEVWDSEEGDEVSSDSPTSATAAPLSPASTVAARPVYSPLASPNSTYNLALTVPSPTS